MPTWWFKSFITKQITITEIWTQRKFYSSNLGVISQSFRWNLLETFHICQIFQKFPYFCQFYYRNYREQNSIFTKICGSQQKMNKPKWNLAYVEKTYCSFFAKNFVWKRTSMLKALVFPNYKNMIRIIWFCIVLTVKTCSMHKNLHYHVRSPMVYLKQAITSTLLLAFVAIFTSNNV